MYVTIIAVTMGGMCMALLSMTLGTGRVRVQAENTQRSFYAAEAGLSDVFMRMDEGLLDVPEDEPLLVGSQAAPVPFGTSAYFVEVRTIDSRSYSLISTGIDGRDQERLELVLAEAPSGFFQFAAFGADGVVLDSNAFIDSYDSSVGSYASQLQPGEDFARENGDVGSNSDIHLQANTEIHGDARPGPGGILDDSAPNTYVSGSTDPSEELVELPPIEIPSIPSAGQLVGTSNVTLGPGLVHYDSILMQGGTTLTIRGPATLVADSFEMKANTQLLFETTDGPIELYAPGDFVLRSNSTVVTRSDSALDVTLLLAGNNTTKNPPDRLELGSNADFVGAIYAPYATFSLNSNFTIFGSIMCGFLDLSSFGAIHFDEALLYDGWGSSDEFEAALWRRLTPNP